jgi:hypothetical protein
MAFPRWGGLDSNQRPNLVGAFLVATVLAVNATRVDGLIALFVSGVVAFYLWRVWVSHGRPGGVAAAGAS